MSDEIARARALAARSLDFANFSDVRYDERWRRMSERARAPPSLMPLRARVRLRLMAGDERRRRAAAAVKRKPPMFARSPRHLLRIGARQRTSVRLELCGV